MPVISRYNIFFNLRNPEYKGWYVLLNTLAGSIDIIDEKIYKILTSFLLINAQNLSKNPFHFDDSVSAEVWDYLDSRGYFFDSYDQEKEQALLLYDELLAFHRRNSRQQIIIIPTYHCNLNCSYCWQRLHNMNSKVISEEMIQAFYSIVPKVIEQYNPNNIDIIIFGGEPLSGFGNLPKRIHSILSKAKQAGYSTKIVTNGVGLGPSISDIANLTDLIQVTMDGPPKVHRIRRPLPKGDSFSPMAEGIVKALSAGIRINLRINVDMQNFEFLPEMAEFLWQSDWLSTNLMTVHLAPIKDHKEITSLEKGILLVRKTFETVKNCQNLSNFSLDGFAGIKYFNSFKETALLPLHRLFNCEAQINLLAFDLLGDIYACWDAAGIKDLSVGKYWPSLKIKSKKLEMWRTRKGIDIELCQSCPVLPNCGGGCQFIAYERHNCFNHPVCDTLLEEYRLAIETNEEWLMEHARLGDHAVGLVSANQVISEVTSEYGYLDHVGQLSRLRSC